MQEFSTPMMKQYMEIKKQYQDCILFFRMGDFYELFLEDAHIGAQVLNITLTSRPKGKDGRIPMAGVPYHAVDSYLAKLVKAGHKVAICEQVSLPNKYGIVDREVVRIVTPGTVLDEKALEKKENNYLLCMDISGDVIAFSFADLSTGYFGTYEIAGTNSDQIIRDELAKLQPSECIISETLYNDPEFLKVVKTEKNANIFTFEDWQRCADNAETILKKHFSVATLSSFGLDTMPLCTQTSAILLGYLQYTQKAPLNHIKKITKVETSDHLIMDRSTMLNLELFSTIREHDVKGSLLNVLDHTNTAMGGRLLKQWIKKPLVDKTQIEQRFDAVSLYVDNSRAREELQDLLKQIPDMERLLSRLSVNIGNARDLLYLKQALTTVLDIKQILISNNPVIQRSDNALVQQLSMSISPQLQDTVNLIESTINPEPPIDVKIGGLIRNGIDKKLDMLRKTVNGSKEWLTELERSEREKTGISSLKIKFNKVFGFYIEISKANLHLAPDYFMRKQTLVNGERFITTELKKHEEIILTAEEKIYALEFELFTEILQKILINAEAIQVAANAIAEIDCLINFAYIAEKHNYTRPTLLYSGEIRITEGRHPVVETLLAEKQFVPNDVSLDNMSQQLLLITGPNMAGKSVFIRQTALIVLMTQIGCFVPATKAHISIVDRIFVRSGASDVITSGLSTFMVEMVETAHILHHATKNSLIVMDEIGRGTSTYDGISIAWAVAEYLVKHFKQAPKTLFATHYHELQALEEQYPNGIKNFHMAVVDDKGVPIFLYSLLPGGASHSFGVAVAKLAGIPDPVIRKAKEMLKTLEQRERDIPKDLPKENELPHQMNLLAHLLQKELQDMDIHQMTPLEALNTLAALKDKLKLYQDQTLQQKTLEN
jgi:DNA mismatch repair protein MutS